MGEHSKRWNWVRRPLYYGWSMLVAVSIAQVVSWGILYYAFSAFVAPMQSALGWSSIELTGAYSLMLLCAGLAAVPVGRWLDRHGPRLLMTLGSILATLLVVAWSQVQQLSTFYLIMAGIGLVSAALLYEPAFAIVAVWFYRLRPRALALLTFFGAFASFIFIPLSAWLISQLGWRGALVGLATILALVTIPIHALMLRRRPQDMGLLPDGEPPLQGETATQAQPRERSLTTASALREPRFWLISAAFAASTFAGVTMTISLIPYLSTHGHTTSFAATIAGLFGLMSLVGRLASAPIAERVSRLKLTLGLILVQGTGLAVLAVAGTSPIGALIYIALFGASSGILTIMRAALLAEQYGPAHYGAINGAQNLVLTGARTVAPVGAGVVVSALGGYEILLWGLVGLLILGAASMTISYRRA